jgi:hypothetical protein
LDTEIPAYRRRGGHMTLIRDAERLQAYRKSLAGYVCQRTDTGTATSIIALDQTLNSFTLGLPLDPADDG